MKGCLMILALSGILCANSLSAIRPAKNYVSEPLQMSPQDGRGLNCYFPMPFKKAARIEVVNECDTTLMLYFYIDYEEKEFDDCFLYRKRNI